MENLKLFWKVIRPMFIGAALGMLVNDMVWIKENLEDMSRKVDRLYHNWYI